MTTQVSDPSRFHTTGRQRLPQALLPDDTRSAFVPQLITPDSNVWAPGGKYQVWPVLTYRGWNLLRKIAVLRARHRQQEDRWTTLIQ